MSCAHLNGTDGLWYLADCHEEKNYICKASTDPPVTPKPTKDGFCVKRFEDYLPGSDYCYKMFSNWDEFGANDYNLWSKVGKMDQQGLILDTFFDQSTLQEWRLLSSPESLLEHLVLLKKSLE